MPFREIKSATYCEFKKGEYLISEGEEVKFVYYLTQGIVKRMQVDSSGAKRTIEQRDAKEIKGTVNAIIGVALAYSTQEKAHSRYVFKAMTDCKCYRIEKEEYRKWAHEHNDILEDTIRLIIRENADTNDWIENKRYTGAMPTYVCQKLLLEAKKCGDKYFLPDTFVASDMAFRMGIHKVTMSRIMRALKEAGVLKKVGKVWEIQDYEALVAFAEGEPLKYK